jgi:hypothetical protein
VVRDGEKVALDDHIEADATLTLIPAVQGGSVAARPS